MAAMRPSPVPRLKPMSRGFFLCRGKASQAGWSLWGVERPVLGSPTEDVSE